MARRGGMQMRRWKRRIQSEIISDLDDCSAIKRIPVREFRRPINRCEFPRGESNFRRTAACAFATSCCFVVVHVGCIADLVHPCPLACPSLVHRPSTDNATAVPRQANSSRPGVNGSQCSSITACSCRCLLFKHLTRSALVP